MFVITKEDIRIAAEEFEAKFGRPYIKKKRPERDKHRIYADETW